MRELKTSCCIQFFARSAPECTRNHMKAGQKEPCPLTHSAVKQDLGATTQELWMPPLLAITEKLVPGPGRSHRLLLRLFSKTGALHWASGNLAYMYTHRQRHFGYRTGF